ncbi:hypothetical protein PV10_08940 [Exophiala mesophila]|uniref:Uncharacterized protein n=1 Tax=Exophiala mesophila TaxID=212818 RepID=A0A0D1Z640_EXOME|nr:uncharacterized protein PV10_08940 [Exophiala mesophila]KIV89364.1 hypothetical protein PV10_08940 [Exophiala mesophila]
MTKRKPLPSRAYDTFPSDSASQPPGPDTETPSTTSYHGADSDKSRSAAAEARRLGSMGSWGDRFSGGTPSTDPTPDVSTIDEEDNGLQSDVRYPLPPKDQDQDQDPSDPPPMYTPAATSSTVPSPEITRATLVNHDRVRHVPTSTSPLIPPPTRHSSEYLSPGSTVSEDRDDYPIDELDDPYATSLPEPVQHGHRETSTGRPKRHGSWCGSRRRRRQDSPCSTMDRKARVRRFKRSCCFVLTVLVCLWLMIPGLCKSYADKSGDTEVPTVGNAGPGPSTNDTWGPTREIVHRETSHSITGSFKLYDLLDLSTKSGSISITVEVQPGEKPAHMRLSTSSGSINVRVVQFEGAGRWLSWASSKIAKPVEGLNSLDRMFVTEISTNSGSVNGNVLHGNGGTTSISTSSGSINLSFYVVGVSSGDPTSKITTNSKSGSQNIKVIPYARFADSYSEQASTSAIRAMQNLHRISGSGSITVKYPSEWEGRLHIEQTGSGSMMAGGAGLNVDRREPKELWAWKGESPSDAPVVEIRELGSGSIHFQV